MHADIKTGNVLVEKLAGDAFRAVVIDFGLAQFSDGDSSSDPRVVSGTPDYLAPELIRGEAPTVASDLYAVGIVLYELLSGTTPFGGGTPGEILDRHLADAVVPPSLRRPDRDIPRVLEAIVLRALAKDPSARYTTAAEFRAALCAAIPALLLRSPHLARGTEVSCSATIASPDGDSLVASCLELVHALIARHDLDAAVAELERGLAILRPAGSSAATPSIWRLQLCLAGLYSGLGDPAQARLAAILGRDDAVRAASVVGEDRARALLVRIARRAKRNVTIDRR